MTERAGKFLERLSDVEGRAYYRYECPGCGFGHAIGVGEGPSPRWSFDGNFEAPTFSPSILARMNFRDGPGDEQKQKVCHHFVRAGRIEFLSDCTHGLAGQTVPMIPLADED